MLLVFGCKENVEKKDNSLVYQKPKKQMQFNKVYSLSKKNGDFIGDIFVNSTKDTIFNYLYVVNKKDTIYKIEKNILRNANGIDIQLYPKGFDGYIFFIIRKDYFVLSGLSNNGENVSDDINIEWNYEKGLLEVLKTP